MADSTLGINVSGAESLDRAIRALGEADDSLAVNIPKEMVLLANRLADIAKRRVLEEPTHGIKQTGLRAAVSEGVSVEEIPGGAHISTSVPRSNEAELPRGMDEPVRGWRHPVYGNRSNWVTQHDAFSWFMDSMQGGQDDGQQALQRLLEEAAQKIAAETA